MNLDDMKKCTISEHLIQVSNIQTMKKGTTQMSALEVSFKFPLYRTKHIHFRGTHTHTKPALKYLSRNVQMRNEYQIRMQFAVIISSATSYETVCMCCLFDI